MYAINSPSKVLENSFHRETVYAHENIGAVFKNSPQFKSDIFSKEINGSTTFKIEFLNPIGCFKGRGTEYLFHKRHKELSGGVVAASAGNFGQGLAYSARKYGVKCCIYVPRTANEFKVEKILSLGAEVILYGKDFDEAKSKAKEVASQEGLYFVEDGCEVELSVGAGTIAYELLKDGASYDHILVPLGNGSLINGVAKYMKLLSPNTKILGVCAEGAPAMMKSFNSKCYIETSSTDTIADGIAVRTPVQQALRDLFHYVDEVVIVSDEQIRQSMKAVFNAHRLIVEPAGIVGLTALLSDPNKFHGKDVAIPLCGSNVTDTQMKDLIFKED